MLGIGNPETLRTWIRRSEVDAGLKPGVTSQMAEENRALHKEIAEFLAPAIVSKAPDELLWSRADGQPLRPPTTTHWFGAAVKRCQAADAKFPRVTVHELRHTAASLMIASRANVKTVQSQLGHKTATMTLDQYGHLFPDDLDDVADKIDDLVSGCAQKGSRPGQKYSLTSIFFVELPGIEPVSASWSQVRTGAELRNDILCDSPELTSLTSECAQNVPSQSLD